jgi:hypothetical protein
VFYISSDYCARSLSRSLALSPSLSLSLSLLLPLFLSLSLSLSISLSLSLDRDSLQRSSPLYFCLAAATSDERAGKRTMSNGRAPLASLNWPCSLGRRRCSFEALNSYNYHRDFYSCDDIQGAA